MRVRERVRVRERELKIATRRDHVSNGVEVEWVIIQVSVAVTLCVG